MDPLTMMLLNLGMAGGGALMNWLGQGKPEDQTADWFSQFNAANGYDPNNRDLNAGRSNSFWDALTGGGSMNPQGWLNSANYYNQQGQNALGSAMDMANRSGTDIWSSFAKTQPGMIDFANAGTNAAMMQNGTSMEALAQAQSQSAIRDLERRLGASGALGTANGASLAALARGASEPLMAAQAQLGQMRSGAFQNLFNPMAQAGYAREMNRGNEFLNALGAATQAGGTYGGIGGNLAALMNDQAQQYIVKPDLVTNPSMWSSMGGALMGQGFQGFGNTDWSKIFANFGSNGGQGQQGQWS